MLGYEPSRAQTIKTILNFAIFISVLIIGTVLLAAFARGYTFDRDSGEVVRYGLVEIESQPTSAQVVLDDELTGETTPYKEAFNEGTYTVKIQRENFIPWQKQITVQGGEVINLTYPLMVPNQSTFTPIIPLVSQQFPTRSPNNTYLLRQIEDNLVLRNLNTIDSLSEIEVPASVGDRQLQNVVWSKNEDIAVLTFDQGASERTYLLNTQSGELQLINEYLTGFSIDGVVSSTSNFLIGHTDNNNLVLVDLEDGDRTVLSRNATNPSWVNGTVVWFDVSENRLLGYRDEERVRIPTLSDVTSSTRFEISEYNGKLTIAYLAEGRLNVIVGALQDPFERRMDNISKIRAFSPSGRFLLVESGETLATFDLKDYDQYYTDLKLSDYQNVSWANAEHLTALRGDEHMVFDFDGQNLQTIALLEARQTFLSPNLAFSYAITGQRGNQTLHRIELVRDELL